MVREVLKGGGLGLLVSSRRTHQGQDEMIWQKYVSPPHQERHYPTLEIHIRDSNSVWSISWPQFYTKFWVIQIWITQPWRHLLYVFLLIRKFLLVFQYANVEQSLMIPCWQVTPTCTQWTFQSIPRGALYQPGKRANKKLSKVFRFKVEYTKEISCQPWNTLFFGTKIWKSWKSFKCLVSCAIIFMLIYFVYLRLIYTTFHNGYTLYPFHKHYSQTY